MHDKPLTVRHIRLGLQAGGVVLAVLVAGCTPAYNWRQISHEGAPASMLMPCKPERAQRSVPLMGAGAPLVELSMLSCEVQGHRFAWAAVRLSDGAEPAQVLLAWRRASWAALQQAVPDGEDAPANWTLTHITAPSGVRERWSGPALNHQAQALQAHVQWQQAGGWVHQAAVYAAQPDAEVVNTFLNSHAAR